MADRKPVTDVVDELRCDPQDLEGRNASNTDPGPWGTPSLQELEEVLHSAPRSCRHCDEVWPNLYLGDMWVSCLSFNSTGMLLTCYLCMCVRFMSHNRLGLWQLGITHVLNAAHGKLCCKGSDDFYGTTVKYYGVPANDLPTFDLSSFFYPAAEFIHQALTSGGEATWGHTCFLRGDTE